MLNAICYNLLWFGGGFVTGVASFGANLFAVPFVALLLPPRESILLGCISGTAVFAAMSAIYARHIRWGGAALLTAGALAGIPLGVWALAHAGPRALLLGAAFFGNGCPAAAGVPRSGAGLPCRWAWPPAP